MTNLNRFTKDIPELIRTHRKKSGLTQVELADLADVGKTVIFDLEHGKISIRLDIFLRILDALNIELELKSPLLKALKELES